MRAYKEMIGEMGLGEENVFEQLPGDVLEGGMSLEVALQKLSALNGRVCMHLIELAMQIEYSAYDLYRCIADSASGIVEREAFFTIAQAEKSHMRTLIKAMADCS